MFCLAKEALSPLNVWKNSWSLYRNSLSKVVAIIFAFLLVFGLGLFGLQKLSGANGSVLQIYTIIFFLLQLYIYALTFLKIYKTGDGEFEKGIKASKSCNHKYLRVLGASFLLYAVILCLTVSLLVVFPKIFSNLVNPVSFFGIIGFSSVFILSFCLFYLPAILVEDKNIFTCFVRSWKLIIGNWWRNILIFLVLLCVLAFVIFCVSTLCSAIMNIKPESAALKVLVFLISITMQSLLVPLAFSTIAVQYNDLKNRQK